jgi:transient receptor potential cation channel subfamily M protein 3
LLSSQYIESGHLSLIEDLQYHVEPSHKMFTQPFNELLVWSVLTKRQDMAKLMWHHGEESLAKALVASKLYQAMAIEAADDDLEVEISDELRSYAAEFDREALELLDYCYRQDDDLAMQLLTCELSNWSRQTCLRLAFACNHRELLAHPGSQLILGDLWLGGLRTRRSTNLKIVLAIICPPLILQLEFKSKKELQLMPQTEEEHMTDLNDEGDPSEMNHHSSSCSSSPIVSTQTDHIKANKAKRANTFKCVEPSNSDDPECNFCTNDIDSDINNLPPSQTDSIEGVKNIHSETIGPGCAALHHHHQLPFTRKLLEFYAAPITKFWTWTIAYFFFLAVYTYTLLVRTPPNPEWNEYYVIVYIASFGSEKLREILASEPVNLKRKLLVWASSMWNCSDAFFIVEFFVGMILRNHENTLDHGRVLYCLNIVYWWVKFNSLLSHVINYLCLASIGTGTYGY